MKQIALLAISLVIAVPAQAQTAEQLNSAEHQRMMTSGPPSSYSPPPMPIASTCPPGTHWAEGGYARHSKWRTGYCARN